MCLASLPDSLATLVLPPLVPIRSGRWLLSGYVEGHLGIHLFQKEIPLSACNSNIG
jgi:hypothetical protein